MREMDWWLMLQWSNREEDEMLVGEVEMMKNNMKGEGFIVQCFSFLEYFFDWIYGLDKLNKMG